MEQLPWGEEVCNPQKVCQGEKKNQLATVYIDSNGKKRYQGNSRLKGSQCGTQC